METDLKSVIVFTVCIMMLGTSRGSFSEPHVDGLYCLTGCTPVSACSRVEFFTYNGTCQSKMSSVNKVIHFIVHFRTRVETDVADLYLCAKVHEKYRQQIEKVSCSKVSRESKAGQESAKLVEITGRDEDSLGLISSTKEPKEYIPNPTTRKPTEYTDSTQNPTDTEPKEYVASTQNPTKRAKEFSPTTHNPTHTESKENVTSTRNPAIRPNKVSATTQNPTHTESKENVTSTRNPAIRPNKVSATTQNPTHTESKENVTSTRNPAIRPNKVSATTQNPTHTESKENVTSTRNPAIRPNKVSATTQNPTHTESKENVTSTRNPAIRPNKVSATTQNPTHTESKENVTSTRNPAIRPNKVSATTQNPTDTEPKEYVTSTQNPSNTESKEYSPSTQNPTKTGTKDYETFTLSPATRSPKEYSTSDQSTTAAQKGSHTLSTIVSDATHNTSMTSESSEDRTEKSVSFTTDVPTKACPPSSPFVRYAKKSSRQGNRQLYKCRPGYKSDESIVSTCVDGKWTTPTGKCTDVPTKACPSLSPYVRYAKKSSRQGNRQLYKCRPGYKSDKSIVSTCVDGKWATPTGKCTGSFGKCKSPPSIRRARPLRRSRSRMYFKCNKGYFAPGSLYHTCIGTRWRLSKLSCKIQFGKPKSLGVIADSRLDDVSGLAASRQHPGYLYMHNDHDDEAEVYMVASDTAQTVAVLTIKGATNNDWEDIAVGPCGDDNCIYIADIGGHGGGEAIDAHNIIYRVKEPKYISDMNIKLDGRLKFTWEPENSDVLLVDEKENLFSIVTDAEDFEEAALFKLPATWNRARPRRAKFITKVNLEGKILGGDISPNGKTLAVATKTGFAVWDLSQGRRLRPLKYTVHREPVIVDFDWSNQAQGIAFKLDDSGVFITFEGQHMPLYFIPRL